MSDCEVLDEQLLDNTGFRSAAAGRWIMPLDTMICHFDPALLRLVGLPEDHSRLPLTRYFQHVHPDDAIKLHLLTEEVVEHHRAFDVTFRLQRADNGENVWINSRGHVEPDANGRLYVFGANYDVTAFKQREEQSRLVAGEMSHRIKNLLTVVQSLFRVSAVRAENVDDLKNSFTGRLNALRALNDAIMNPSVRLNAEALVHGVMAPVLGDGRASITVDAAPLNEEAAQTLSLCLNELMTNAIKYGALSNPLGRLTVELRRDESRNRFSLSWREEGGKLPDQPPSASGFGFTMLQDITRMSFDGKPTVTWHSDGLHFRCDWPADRVCNPA